MKKFVLAAIATLVLGAASAYAAPTHGQNDGMHSRYQSFSVGGDGAAG